MLWRFGPNLINLIVHGSGGGGAEPDQAGWEEEGNLGAPRSLTRTTQLAGGGGKLTSGRREGLPPRIDDEHQVRISEYGSVVSFFAPKGGGGGTPPPTGNLGRGLGTG